MGSPLNLCEKRVRIDEDQNLGDCYTFVAVERNTKLVLNIVMGKRDKATTDIFIEGLRDAPVTALPIPDNQRWLRTVQVRNTRYIREPCRLRHAHQVYRANPEAERKYSPAEVASVEVVPVSGRPDPMRICTSIVERSNLSLRVGVRRCTRLTNAFSKKWENHWAAMSIWYTFYNF